MNLGILLLLNPWIKKLTEVIPSNMNTTVLFLMKLLSTRAKWTLNTRLNDLDGMAQLYVII
jgi:hypothetical protein